MSLYKKLLRQGFVFAPAKDKGGAEPNPDHGTEDSAAAAMGITPADLAADGDPDNEWDNLEDQGDGAITTNHGDEDAEDVIDDQRTGEFDNDALEQEFEGTDTETEDADPDETQDDAPVAVDYDELARRIVAQQQAEAASKTAAPVDQTAIQQQIQRQEASDRARLTEIADLRLVDPVRAEELFLQLTEERAERKLNQRQQVQTEATRLRDSMVAEMAGDDPDARAFVLSQIGDLSVDQLRAVSEGPDKRYRTLLARATADVKAEKAAKARQAAPGKGPRVETGRPAPRSVQVSDKIKAQIAQVQAMGGGVGYAEAFEIVTGKKAPATAARK